MSAENVALARRGYEAVIRGDLDVIADVLDPEVKWHGGDPDDEAACHNRRETLAFMRNARGGGPGELIDVVDAGDRVVVIMRARGEERLVANLTTFRDGKVVEMVHYPEAADALAAAGITPTG